MAEDTMGDAGGAASLGYYSCSWRADGGAVAAHGFTGALHLWERRRLARQLPGLSAASAAGGAGGGAVGGISSAAAGGAPRTAVLVAGEEEDGAHDWVPRVACGGHYGAITDLAWAFGGRCLLSCGADMTTRLLVRLPGGGGAGSHWCELARAQVREAARALRRGARRGSMPSLRAGCSIAHPPTPHTRCLSQLLLPPMFSRMAGAWPRAELHRRAAFAGRSRGGRRRGRLCRALRPCRRRQRRCLAVCLRQRRKGALSCPHPKYRK